MSTGVNHPPAGTAARSAEDMATLPSELSLVDFEVEARNLDGIPVVVRDELNRDYLETRIENHSRPGAPPDPYLLTQLHEIRDSLDGGYVPDHAANDLTAFQGGLRATHQGDSPSRNTVIGHSGYFEDDETLDYLGDVLTGGRR